MLDLKHKNESLDGSVKLLWESESKQIFESVVVPFKDKGTYAACISSQSGCACKCNICETAFLDYSGTDLNLSSDNLLEQAELSKYYGAKFYPDLKFDEISFMGMGEPLLNFNNVIKTIEHLTNNGETVAISTIGFPKKIYDILNYDLNKYPRLQLSFHSLKDRESLIPLERLFPFVDTYAAGVMYAKITKTPLSLNWVLLQGINDSLEHAENIAKFIDPEICRLNITSYVGNRYNQTKPQDKKVFIEKIRTTSKEIHSKELEVHSFDVLGNDINAGCGQLVGKYAR